MPLLSSACEYIPQRWIVCFLCSVALAIINYKNTSFYHVAEIIKLMSEPKLKKTSRTITTKPCPFRFLDTFGGVKELPFVLPELYWNPHTINLSDSAFHMGRLLTLIPAGLLSDLGYTRCVLGTGMMMIAASQIARPAFAGSRVHLKMLENLFEGIGEATVLPGIVSLISYWTPPWERNLFTGLVVSGLCVGDVLGHLAFSGIYTGTSWWSTGHYATGVVAALWSVLCFVFIYQTPDLSPFISHREFRTIEHTRRRSSLEYYVQELHGVPWRRIVTSSTFISIVLSYCALEWVACNNVESNLSSYQVNVLHLPQKFGYFSTAGQIISLPTVIFGGYFADWLIVHELLSKTAVKRMFISVSIIGSSVFSVLSVLIGCNVTMFWAFSLCAYYFHGLAFAVIYCIPVDLYRRHAGLLMGIMHCAMTICALFNLEMQPIMFPNEDNWPRYLRKTVFFAVLAVVMIIPFLFLGSVEKQKWKKRGRSSIRSYRRTIPAVDASETH